MAEAPPLVVFYLYWSSILQLIVFVFFKLIAINTGLILETLKTIKQVRHWYKHVDDIV